MKKKIEGRTVQTLYEKAGIVSPPKPALKEPTVVDATKAIGEIVKQLKSHKKDPDKAVADQAQALLARMKEAKDLLSEVGTFLEGMSAKAQSSETDE